jgi:hypothetical protein
MLLMISGRVVSVPIDDYEPIPGRDGEIEQGASSTATAAAASPTAAPPAPSSQHGNSVAPPADIYAVVNKPKAADADRKPPTRNLSELYAKVLKPKISSDLARDVDTACRGDPKTDLLTTSTTPHEDHHARAPVADERIDSKTRDVGHSVEIRASQDAYTGYDTVEFKAVESNSVDTDYDNVYDNDVDEKTAQKDDVYEEMEDIIEKISQSKL